MDIFSHDQSGNYDSKGYQLPPTDLPVHYTHRQPTYDPAQVVEPSIVDFAIEYGIASWAGYRFWMAYTPYPFGEALFEDPCIAASNDGKTWTVPPGMPLPLYEGYDLMALWAKMNTNGGVEQAETRLYFNDPWLVYDPDCNVLLLYHHFNNLDSREYSQLWMTAIDENMKRSPPMVSPARGPAGPGTSATIWREDKFNWHMWYIVGPLEPPSNKQWAVRYCYSKDGLTWDFESSKECNNDAFYNFPSMLNPYHISCKPNPNNAINAIDFIVVVYPWTDGHKPNDGPWSLILARCPKDDLTTLSIPVNDFILSPSTDPMAFDNDTVYRAGFVIDHDDIAQDIVYNIWYSGRQKTIGSDTGRWGVGYTQGKLV